MTLDKSLKVRAGSIKTRNVLTRAERIKRLQDIDKWSEDSTVVGMAKVRVPKIPLKKKKKDNIKIDVIRSSAIPHN